jgi:hypothetical protein
VCCIARSNEILGWEGNCCAFLKRRLIGACWQLNYNLNANFFLFFFFAMFYVKNRITERLLFWKQTFNYVPIKHKQMSFVSNGGKFKLYTVLNGLIFPTPIQPRISFERPILLMCKNYTVYIKLWFLYKKWNIFVVSVGSDMTGAVIILRKI